MISTLPIFRVAGYTQTVSRETTLASLNDLRQRWFAAPPALKAFSPTVYAVLQYPDENTVKITFGKLVATDTELPENLSDAWIAPQVYELFETNDVADTWAQIAADGSLNRRFLADLVVYPSVGAAKVYVGVVGEVEISEA